MVLHLLVFWVVTDLFSGISLNEGVVGYLVCGGIYGLVMAYAIPLIKFFTLPIKFISILLVTVMLSIVVFFLLNLGIPFIDFTDGTIVGFSNRFIDLPQVELSMMGNVLVGGLTAGVISSLIRLLEKGE